MKKKRNTQQGSKEELLRILLLKYDAIDYLFRNSVYGNEWQGSGMWEAVEEIMRWEQKYVWNGSSQVNTITREWLGELLKKAGNK